MMSQVYECWKFCSRGLYSCRWRGSSDKKKKCTCWSFSVVTVMSLLFLCWMYICFIVFNDRQDVNGEIFKHLKLHVNWFMIIVIISAVLASYFLLLLLFALTQVALKEELYLHWLHRIVLFFGVLFLTALVMALSIIGKREWQSVLLSLEAMAPFLQFGAVGALTLLSPFIFQRFHVAKKCSRVLIAVVFLAASAAIFLCPLLIHSPCLIHLEELPEKPNLIGHRGAPMLAPENTMMSFNRSLECNVTAFETDVQLSKDGIPFLMHDNGSNFLLRTTNVQYKFPGKSFNSTDLTLAELQSLNAGEWFVKTDPFHTVSQLSEEEKETARNQTIPTLQQLLNFAKQHRISVIFDLYNFTQSDTEDTVHVILNSDIDPSLVRWLPSEKRELVKAKAPNFIQIYESKTDMLKNNGTHLNVYYSELTTKEIRDLRKNNITVNLWVVNERWLFSLLWCAGASSVTTNSCHLLNKMDRPDWILQPSTYKITWILVDISSALMMIVLFHCKKCCFYHDKELRGNTTTASRNNENRSFLRHV